MNMNRLINYTQKPEIYTKGTAEMWVDDHISRQLLEVHLNPDIDLASRKGPAISKTVDWISEQVCRGPLDILDLGCGPGLYTQRFAEKGHRVTGMDYSLNSIDYARRSAQERDLAITYRHQNYLTLEEENRYDLVLMIFTDFGVLSPGDRDLLLSNIHRALKPGGRFIFDTLNENYLEKTGPNDWQASDSGFWSDKPHLALSGAFLYEEEKVVLNQHVVVEASGDMAVYRFWTHGYSQEDLKRIVAKQGFEKTSCHDGVIPDSEIVSSREVTFCVTAKPPAAGIIPKNTDLSSS